jgi:hypothetical protein
MSTSFPLPVARRHLILAYTMPISASSHPIEQEDAKPRERGEELSCANLCRERATRMHQPATRPTFSTSSCGGAASSVGVHEQPRRWLAGCPGRCSVRRLSSVTLRRSRRSDTGRHDSSPVRVAAVSCARLPHSVVCQSRGSSCTYGAVRQWKPRIGCSSIPFGATPVCPCLKSKNATPVMRALAQTRTSPRASAIARR